MALSERATTAAAGAVGLGVYLAKQSGWFEGWAPIPDETISFLTLAIATLFSAVANRSADPAAQAREAAVRVVEQAPDGVTQAELAAAIRRTAPAGRDP